MSRPATVRCAAAATRLADADPEVVDQAAVGVERLRADARWRRAPRRRRADFGHVGAGPPRRTAACSASRTSRASRCASACARTARTPVCDRSISARSRAETSRQRVALAGQWRAPRWGRPTTLAVDARGDVHAEERVARIGHRIDQAVDQVAPLRAAARSTRRGTARSTGSGPSPASSASRSVCRPPQITTWSKASWTASPSGGHDDLGPVDRDPDDLVSEQRSFAAGDS